MLKSLRSSLAVLLALCLTTALRPAPALAADTGAEQCVRDFLGALGNDWGTVLALTNSLDLGKVRENVENETAQHAHGGILNVRSATVTEIIEAPYDDPAIASAAAEQEERFGEGLRAFVASVTMSVYEESHEAHNGANIFLAVTTQEGGAWKIATIGPTSAAMIEKLFPAAARTAEQDKVFKLRRLWETHEIGANMEGRIIEFGWVFQPFHYFDTMLPHRPYTPGQFTDLDENAWYGAEKEGALRGLYQYRLLDGMGDGIMAPEENLTLAQAVKLAVMVHSTFKYINGERTDFAASSPWYGTYIDYALENGLITEEDGFNYDIPATRAQAAYLFANCVSPELLAGINGEVGIADVDEDTPYAESIRLLYAAGVLQGRDGGNFCPDEPIARAGAAAILLRVIRPEKRIFTF